MSLNQFNLKNIWGNIWKNSQTVVEGYSGYMNQEKRCRISTNCFTWHDSACLCFRPMLLLSSWVAIDPTRAKVAWPGRSTSFIAKTPRENAGKPPSLCSSVHLILAFFIYFLRENHDLPGFFLEFSHDFSALNDQNSRPELPSARPNPAWPRNPIGALYPSRAPPSPDEICSVCLQWSSQLSVCNGIQISWFKVQEPF